MRTSRLEAFSDGVFAIPATLLVLELRVPSDSADVVAALLHLWPAYAAYLVSFSDDRHRGRPPFMLDF